MTRTRTVLIGLTMLLAACGGEDLLAPEAETPAAMVAVPPGPPSPATPRASVISPAAPVALPQR